jgi:thiol:disulfide interchange protein
LNWDIAKGYYLYKKKIKIVSDHSHSDLLPLTTLSVADLVIGG